MKCIVFVFVLARFGFGVELQAGQSFHLLYQCLYCSGTDVDYGALTKAKITAFQELGGTTMHWNNTLFVGVFVTTMLLARLLWVLLLQC